MGDQAGFEAAVKKVERFVQFDLPSRVQVFETTIRVIGGLLSAHIYASSPALGHQIPGYKGSMLSLAVDLADRLMPAFDTPTGIPLARVNLRHGKYRENITETCTAGAGSLVLEFATLSRLTGDDKYEAVARRAFFAIWERRTALDIVGTSIDAMSGLWLSAMSGVGASVDSFYEYALKSYILLGDEQFLEVFTLAYTAIKENMLDGWLYKNIHMVTGHVITTWIDALAAFFPGLQVLAGDLNAAAKSHLVYYKIWMSYAGTPERWNYVVGGGSLELGWYGLRPEFVESNYMLYRATKDPFYLHVGAQILSDLQSRTRVACGYASIHDVTTGELDDRMESFFLSETLKYLYLLFDVDNPINNDDSNFVFSTEAHPLRIDANLLNSTGRMTNLRGQSQYSKSIPRQDPNAIVETTTDRVLEFSNDEAFLTDKSTYFDENDMAISEEYRNYLISTATCQSVTDQDSFYSRITSWGEFYHLDGLYNFTSPISDRSFRFATADENRRFASHSSNFSSNVRPRVDGSVASRRAIIDLPPTDPNARSTPLQKASILEVFFPSDRQSSIEQRGQDLEASSFDGHRVRFRRLDLHKEEPYVNTVYQDESSSGATRYHNSFGGSSDLPYDSPSTASSTRPGMRILTIGGIKVLGNVKVRNLMSRRFYDQEVFEVLRDGRVRLRGEDIVNLMVG